MDCWSALVWSDLGSVSKTHAPTQRHVGLRALEFLGSERPWTTAAVQCGHESCSGCQEHHDQHLLIPSTKVKFTVTISRAMHIHNKAMSWCWWDYSLIFCVHVYREQGSGASGELDEPPKEMQKSELFVTTSAGRGELSQVSRWIQSYNKQVFWVLLYTLVVIAIFAERAYSKYIDR